MTRRPILHYRARDGYFQGDRWVPTFVPACWNGTWNFIPATLTPDPDRVECEHCRNWLATATDPTGEALR